jgi:hypothetical protein
MSLLDALPRARPTIMSSRDVEQQRRVPTINKGVRVMVSRGMTRRQRHHPAECRFIAFCGLMNFIPYQRTKRESIVRYFAAPSPAAVGQIVSWIM